MLPMSLLTEWLWTGSLYAFIRICKERLAPDAQSETRAVAEGIYGSLREYFPDSMKAWALDREEAVAKPYRVTSHCRRLQADGLRSPA